MNTRRNFLANVSSSATLVAMPWALVSPVSVSQSLAQPDPLKLESGDLLWPKKPTAYVPFQFDSTMTESEERARWEYERNEFVASQRQNAKYLTESEINYLASISYQEFYARYAGDRSLDSPTTYAVGDHVYVGHVAIVEMSVDGKPFVVEALWSKGVVRKPHSQWIEERLGQYVWQGRIRDLAPNDRAAVAAEAAAHVGKPYDFWNLDLGDPSGFYCSKLVWLAAFRAAGIALDGNPNLKRAFWISPKRLLNSPSVRHLNRPAAEAYAWPSQP